MAPFTPRTAWVSLGAATVAGAGAGVVLWDGSQARRAQGWVVWKRTDLQVAVAAAVAELTRNPGLP